MNSSSPTRTQRSSSASPVSDIVAGVLLAELGEDRTRFPTVAALLAETGLAPVTKASGRTRRSESATPPTGGYDTPSIGGCSSQPEKTNAPGGSTTTPAPPVTANTAPCAVWARVGSASYGAAGSTGPFMTREDANSPRERN